MPMPEVVAGDLPAELAVLERGPRLLQGPARPQDRRHPDRHRHHRRQAQIVNPTDRSRASTNEAGVGGVLGSLFGTAVPPATSSPAIDLTSGISDSGEGSVNRSESLETQVAAVVTQVLPNGNLVIEGRQEVRVNFEVRDLIVAGIVRPEDIQRRQHHPLGQDRRGPHRLRRPRPDHRRAAAALRPADRSTRSCPSRTSSEFRPRIPPLARLDSPAGSRRSLPRQGRSLPGCAPLSLRWGVRKARLTHR